MPGLLPVNPSSPSWSFVFTRFSSNGNFSSADGHGFSLILVRCIHWCSLMQRAAKSTAFVPNKVFITQCYSAIVVQNCACGSVAEPEMWGHSTACRHEVVRDGAQAGAGDLWTAQEWSVKGMCAQGWTKMVWGEKEQRTSIKHA